MARDKLEGELRAFVDEGYSPRPRVYLGTEEAEEQDQAIRKLLLTTRKNQHPGMTGEF